MSALRVLVVLSLAVLSGCLVTFKDPIPANEAAPLTLLGQWQRVDEWGEPETLEVSRSGSNVYLARLQSRDENGGVILQTLSFTVSHHGRRWYLCAGVPKAEGGHFALGGFELVGEDVLVLHQLDAKAIGEDVARNRLAGETVTLFGHEGVLVTAELEQVFTYLDDPANADLFSEMARYRRVK